MIIFLIIFLLFVISPFALIFWDENDHENM